MCSFGDVALGIGVAGEVVDELDFDDIEMEEERGGKSVAGSRTACEDVEGPSGIASGSSS